MTKKKNKSLRILLPVLLIVALVAAGLYAYNLVRTDVAGERGSSAKYTLVIEDNEQNHYLMRFSNSTLISSTKMKRMSYLKNY